jgi:hypothetical protein
MPSKGAVIFAREELRAGMVALSKDRTLRKIRLPIPRDFQ